MCVGRYLESELSDILRHPHPRLPYGRLKNHKYKKSAFGGKKTADCKPLPNSPQGAGVHSRCALGGYDCAPFLEKDWNMDIIWAFFLPRGRALKKSPFFMTKTENAYDL